MIDKTPGVDDFVIAKGEGRLEDAKKSLIIALASIKDNDAKPVRVELTQQFAEICYLQGDVESSIFMYEISEFLDAGSLLAKLNHAKFLFETLGDKNLASKKCQEILDIANDNPFSETEDDFSSDEYKNAVERLKIKMGV